MTDATEHEVRELGLWWLPHDRERQVAGILTYSPTTGAQLELIGALRDPFTPPSHAGSYELTDQHFEAQGNYGRICGVAGGKSFTLEGCFQTSFSNMFAPRAGGTTERIHVGRFIKGAEFEPNEPVDATRVDVRLLHLPYWIAEGGITEKYYLPDQVPEDEYQMTLAATLLPDHIIPLDNNMVLKLCEQISMAGDRVTERGLRRDFRVQLEGDRLELETYLRVISTFQDLVSIGTDRTATFEEFKFHHPDIIHRAGDSQIPMPIDFYAQWTNWETRQPKSLNSHDLLFNLAELGGDDALRRWCTFTLDHQGTLARVMATRYRSGGYVSDKLFNRAAALEALDRDTHNQDDIIFKKRMLRLANLAGAPFSDAIGDVAQWATRFKAARDAVAHHSYRHPAEAAQSTYYLAEVAYYLFVLCVLRHIDANGKVFERVANNADLQRAGQRLQLAS